MLRLNSLLEAVGLAPAHIRLVRHKHDHRYQRQLHQDAIALHARFEQYQCGQINPKVIEQIRSAEAIASFVVDPGSNTLFVGLWRVAGVKDGSSPDPYMPPQPPGPGGVVFDLQRMEKLDEYRGRLVIDWGGGERAWVQYADRQDKKIIELRRKIEEERFPGYRKFACKLHEVAGLPSAFLEPLRSSRGIYLIVHRESGAQYVGSATGGEGFIGRWINYADGHGGNVGLRELAGAAEEYDVQVLETVGSGATVDDVYELESAWKVKLGSRVRGLNRN
jgi:hypothetical protein